MANKRIKKLIRGKPSPFKAKVVHIDISRNWYPSVYVCIDCANRENIYLPEKIDQPSRWLKCTHCASSRIFLISGINVDTLNELDLEISPELWDKP